MLNKWKKVFKILLQEKGMSAVEMLVGIGIMGGVGLMVAKNMQSQRNTMGRNEEARGVELAVKSISDSLKRRSTCENLLAGLSVSNLVSSGGVDLTAEQIKTWSPLAAAKIGNGTSIEKVNAKLGAGAGETTLVLDLKFTRQKRNAQNEAASFKRKIERAVYVNSGSIACEGYGESEIIEGAVGKICAELGGIYTPGAGCAIDNIDPELRKKIAEGICNSLDASGTGPMDGSLCSKIEVGSALTFSNLAPEKLAISGDERRVFDNEQCSKYLKGYEIDGSKICSDIVFVAP